MTETAAAPAIQAPDQQDDPRLHSIFAPDQGDVSAKPSIFAQGPEPAPAPAKTPAITSPKTGMTPQDEYRQVNPMAGLFAKADNIHNPLLRTLAKIGSGVGTVLTGAAQSATGEDKERYDLLHSQQDNARKNQLHQAQLDKMQQDKYDLKTGVNPKSGEEEHFYMGNDGKPVWTGVAVAKQPGKTMDEQTMAARVKKNVASGMSPEDATLEAFKYVKQGAQDIKPPKIELKQDPNGDVLQYTTDDKGQTTSTVVHHGDPNVQTDIIQRTGDDGVDHNVLVNKKTGSDIKDLGVKGSTAQPSGVGDVLAKYSIQPGDTGQAVMDKIKATDPVTAAAIERVRKYDAPSSSFPTNPRKGTNQLTKSQVEGILGMVDPTWREDQYKVIGEMKHDYTSGKTGKNISNLNQGVHHLNTMLNTIKGQTGVGIPSLNKLIQGAQEEAGFTGALKGKLDVTAVSGELANIFKQSGATDEEISAWRQSIKPNMTNRQAEAVVEGGMDLLAGRLAVQAQRYQAGAGKPYDFSTVDKGTRDILSKLPGGQKVLDVMNVTAAGAGGQFDHNKFPKAN